MYLTHNSTNVAVRNERRLLTSLALDVSRRVKNGMQIIMEMWQIKFYKQDVPRCHHSGNFIYEVTFCYKYYEKRDERSVRDYELNEYLIDGTLDENLQMMDELSSR
ncbi:CLUMA_CG012264, isoform A [Clunio marinus]|uniref:CLUMA_CG012264, isoform A n=1 Tax=Clunio marinus TaxID=568069 RepID=A0A1J1IG25_9DIPT|nr:CLUMA_CG012264, isoform A [Clunio marinus]